MCKHSDAFHMLYGQVLIAKTGGATIVVHSQRQPTIAQAQALLVALLHDIANKAYLDNSGITEDELEELHAFINEGVRV